MDQKRLNELKEYFKEKNVSDTTSREEALKEFLKLHHMSEYDYTPLSIAYSILEKAEVAQEKQQLKYALEALEICPYCVDASILVATLKNNVLEMMQYLENALNEEKERLTKEGFFTKKIIGAFYGVFETRPYIRGLNILAHMYADNGMFKKAISVCENVLYLNEYDNTGVRYLLLGLYACLEDENHFNKLFKKYDEKALHSLVPAFIINYKLNKFEEAHQYLLKIEKMNKHFKKFFKDEIEESDALKGFYSIGGSSEVLSVIEEFDFLFDTVPNIEEFILNNKRNK